MSPVATLLILTVAMVAIAFVTKGAGAGGNNPPAPYGWGYPQRRFNGGAFLAWMFMGCCTILLLYAVIRSPGAVGEILQTLLTDLSGG